MSSQLAVGAPLACFAYGVYLNYGSNTSSSLLLSIISFVPVLGFVAAMSRDFGSAEEGRRRQPRSATTKAAMVAASCAAIFIWMRYVVFVFDFIYWFLFAHHPVISATRATFRAAAVVANASATARIFAASAAVRTSAKIIIAMRNYR
jgi:hypothetical protein